MGPLLPTGTALAATPQPPATAQAAPAPAPAATTAPAPEPTTDPTPAPTQTAEPTPAPTTDPCPALPLAPLGGDPGDAIGQVALEPNDTACFTVEVENPGPHWLRHVGAGGTQVKLYDGETPLDCFNPRTYKNDWCRPGHAGAFTLRVTNGGTSRASDAFAFTPLAATAACGTEVSTRYDAEPVTGTALSRFSLLCQNFTGLPGERITVDTRAEGGRWTYSWITDASGEQICPQFNPDDSTGCVLPGQGPYRVLTEVSTSDSAYPVTYAQKIRRLSDPAGCAALAVHAFGSAPTTSPGSTCATFTPSATAPHDVYDTDGSWAQRLTVYAPDGRTACEAWASTCSLTAGTQYTVVTEKPVQILDRSSSAGCTIAAIGVNTNGTFDVAGEVDCLTLPLPAGAHLAALKAYGGSTPYPEAGVVDATGKQICDSESAEAGVCVLTGPGPYRALVTMYGTLIGSPTMTGTYHVAFQRTDGESSCPVLPAGDFTTDSPRAQVTIGQGDFAQCLSIPADDHTAGELIEFDPSHWSGKLSVFDATGERVCYMTSGGWASCALTPGLAHTVLLSGTYWGTARTVSRHDLTATARGCVTTPATAVGGPSAGGAMPASGTFLCLRVTTDDAGDTLHLGLRDAQGRARFTAYDANGEVVCGPYDSGCAATGSTAYQVLIRTDWSTAPTYRFDALRIGTAAGPAPECVKAPEVSYGFGPLVGTLSEQHTAICAVLPTAGGDDFDLAFTPAGSFEQSPTPVLYPESSSVNVCRGSYTSEGEKYRCSVSGSSSPRVSRPSTLVIGLPAQPAQASTAVRVTAACTDTYCGTEKPSIGTVSPTAGGAGKITVTLTGTALHENDQVAVLGQDGAWRRSTTVSVAPDRHSLTAALDLTGVSLGAHSLSVFSHNGWEYAKGTFTVVAPLRSTAAPTVTGIAVVGGKVTASAGSWSLPVDSLAYQWRANGVAIAGATASTYTIPTTLQGKQLSVAVTARKLGHPTITVISGSVAVKGVAPKPTKVPSMSGTVRVGSKVTAVVGTWSPAPTSYAYQWRANGVAISGATGSSYVPAPAVLGKKLTVTVTALRTGHLSGVYTTAGYSVAVGLAPKATAAPYVTGTVRVGRTLTLNRGAWTPAPTSYAYQWYANGRAISGATKSWFTLTKYQRGTKITVRVTAYRTGHTAGVAWTRATGAVAG
ncbi:hypothetical protein [Streptomyces globisporus]|uniref:hypothetical protein n=1 Tax=Streptomyces globisporus TaxID=1908 RepID=UPI000689321A|nr:hypothetical protein [Streptomyces globisporus]